MSSDKMHKIMTPFSTKNTSAPIGAEVLDIKRSAAAAAVVITAAAIAATIVAAVTAAVAAPAEGAAAAAIAAAEEEDNDQDDDPAAADAIVIAHIEIPPVRCKTVIRLSTSYAHGGRRC